MPVCCKSNPNPFVEIAIFAIALYYADKKESAFHILNELQRHSFLNQYVFLNMALGKFHQLEGNSTMAAQFLNIAYHQSHFDKEKAFIQKMIDKL